MLQQGVYNDYVKKGLPYTDKEIIVSSYFFFVPL